ncbi:MAG: DUF952 domain-containing protein [Trueperaceae bacterium]
MIIYRISTRAAWETAQKLEVYEGEFHSDGFIHLSEKHQVVPIATYLYQGQTDLVLLCIDTDKLTAELHFEQLGTTESFPHLYGVLNLEAMLKVIAFPTNDNGLFDLSIDLKNMAESFQTLPY